MVGNSGNDPGRYLGKNGGWLINKFDLIGFNDIGWFNKDGGIGKVELKWFVKLE